MISFKCFLEACILESKHIFFFADISFFFVFVLVSYIISNLRTFKPGLVVTFHGKIACIGNVFKLEDGGSEQFTM